jgi:sec-independent protein translocase protein TatA
MLGLGAPELIIVLLILLLLFGASRLPKLSKSLGESARELRKGFTDDPHKKEEEKKEA